MNPITVPRTSPLFNNYQFISDYTVVNGSPSWKHEQPGDVATLSDVLDLYAEHEHRATVAHPYVMGDDVSGYAFALAPLTLDAEYQYHVSAATRLRRVILGL